MMLNPKQQTAVTTINGPLLLLAGPGSGKTRTLTHRYHYLMEQGVQPEQILMVTFTRKAANEMKHRIQQHAPQLNMKQTWIETFHRICMNILQVEGHHFHLPTQFKVCNNYESKKIFQQLIDRFDASGGSDEEEPTVTKENLLETISTLKNLLISPASFNQYRPTLACMNWDKSSAYIQELKADNPDLFEAIKQIYPAYQKELLSRNLMDFEDMMFYVVGLFDKKPEVLAKYTSQFRYIMVDEFQDTNHIQLKLVQLLASVHENICVVGDDYQSIYKFRGSEIENILDFERFFPSVQTIKLEHNYRSTKHIVDLSNEIIAHNQNQKQKEVFTENEEGDKIQVIETATSEEEAVVIAKRMRTFHEEQGVDFKEMAVLYRNNSHAPRFAKAFAEEGIPFQITGDTEFHERTEVRDILAYLKWVQNTDDSYSLRRIINKPKRGLGPKAVETVFNEAQNTYDALVSVLEGESIAKAGLNGIEELLQTYRKLSATLRDKGIGQAIEELLLLLDYEKRVYEKNAAWIQEEATEGINELIRLAYLIEKEKGTLSVEQFQEHLAEVFVDHEDTASKVTLMTVHKSKGLEFEAVFVTGLDNATFPNEEKQDIMDDLEEERRVFYVGVTRCKKYLTLTYPRKREKRVDGKMQEIDTDKSLFLTEIWASSHIEKQVQ